MTLQVLYNSTIVFGLRLHTLMIMDIYFFFSLSSIPPLPLALHPSFPSTHSYYFHYLACLVKKQPSQDVLHGDAAEELGLARLVSSYTLPHQNSQPGGRGWQTARSKVLSRRARDT